MGQRLTTEQAALAAADYYRRGKLGFQLDGTFDCSYWYPNTDHRCAIGAGLSDETMEAVKANHYGNVMRLFDAELILFEGNNSANLQVLQHAHDDVVGTAEASCLDPDNHVRRFRAENALARFCGVVNRFLPEGAEPISPESPGLNPTTD